MLRQTKQIWYAIYASLVLVNKYLFRPPRTERKDCNSEYSVVFSGSCSQLQLYFIFARFTNLLNAKILRFKALQMTTKYCIICTFLPIYQFLETKLNCIFAGVDLWMSTFILKLNPLKSQIIVCCNDALKGQLNINSFFLGNSCIRFCDTVRNLGFTLDSHLTLEQQVKECVSSVFASIKSIARIKHLLTRKEVTIVVSYL